jgi:hypothetical protein
MACGRPGRHRAVPFHGPGWHRATGRVPGPCSGPVNGPCRPWPINAGPGRARHRAVLPGHGPDHGPRAFCTTILLGRGRAAAASASRACGVCGVGGGRPGGEGWERRRRHARWPQRPHARPRDARRDRREAVVACRSASERRAAPPPISMRGGGCERGGRKRLVVVVATRRECERTRTRSGARRRRHLAGRGPPPPTEDRASAGRCRLPNAPCRAVPSSPPVPLGVLLSPATLRGDYERLYRLAQLCPGTGRRHADPSWPCPRRADDAVGLGDTIRAGVTTTRREGGGRGGQEVPCRAPSGKRGGVQSVASRPSAGAGPRACARTRAERVPRRPRLGTHGS